MRFKQYLTEKPIATKGWTKASIEKFGKTIGKGPGEKGFFEVCVNRMRDEMGEKAEGFCASIKDYHFGSPKWRGQGKSKEQVKKDTKKNKYKEQLKEK